MRGPRIAFEGCGHGTLHSIYASVKVACEAKDWPSVDLVIIGGDFQAVRNSHDLNCMAVPVKYRELGDFHEYYSGARTAPYTTLFVGGNHEASNYLQELHYGGWVAPNIYYLGAANVLRLGSLRISGVSGIWKGYDYRKAHFERLPYNNDNVRSVFHVREIDARKLLQIRAQVDIGLSHDWPNGIEWQGDWKQLFRFKPYFEDDARSGRLGNTAARYLLDWLRPPFWFSAHMHAKFVAIVQHVQSEVAGDAPDANSSATGDVKNDDELDLGLDDEVDDTPQARPSNGTQKNTDELDLNLDDSDDDQNPLPQPINTPGTTTNPPELDQALQAAEDQLPDSFNRPSPPPKLPEPKTTIHNTTTEFLALDKCLPNRKFLHLREFTSSPLLSDSAEDLRLHYDPEWLAITRAFALRFDHADPRKPAPPDAGRGTYALAIDEEFPWIDDHVTQQNRLAIPDNFTRTAPVYDPLESVAPDAMPREYSNPQTAAYCAMLGIPNAFDASEEEMVARASAGPPPGTRGERGWGGFRGRGRRGDGGVMRAKFRGRGRIR